VTNSRAARSAWGVAVVVAVAAVVVAQIYQLNQPPLPGQDSRQPITGYLAGPLEFIAALSAIATAGTLLGIAWSYRHPHHRHAWKLDADDYRHLGTARRWALAWAMSSLILVWVNSGDVNGVPISWVFRAFGDFLITTRTSQAWLVVAAAGFAIALGCWLTTTWRWTGAFAVLAVFATLPTVVTTQVSVGHDHDFATDGMIIFTLATTFWFAAGWAAGRTARRIGLPATVRRVHRIGVLAVGVAIITRVGIGAFELAGQPPWQSLYGYGIIAEIAALLVLAVRIAVRTPSVTRARGSVTDATRALQGQQIDLAFMLFVLGIQQMLLRLVPHRYRVPQTSAENFLGYNFPHPPELLAAVVPGRPNILFCTISLLMIGLYLWGVVRIRRAGHRWPIGRTVSWVLGWFLVLLLFGSNMWRYSSATFSWHMVVHMTVNMAVPVPMVLGGPVTLWLRATRAKGPGEPVGLHDVATSLISWRAVEIAANPVFTWVNFVGSLYVLYFTGLFGLAMRYHWAHQLMAIHFLVTGYAFYWLVIGVDHRPRPLPHIAKLGYIFAAMPFHAFFAVVILAGGPIIGGDFYRYLGLPWLHDLAAFQRAGGEVAWATGEIPLFAVVIALVWQWFRQDQREAIRKDRAEDTGHDDALAAYNDMLAALAARETRQSTPSVTADNNRAHVADREPE